MEKQPQKSKQQVEMEKAVEESVNMVQKCFIASAYYSPLKGQSSYFNGSYEAEIRMNGRGLNFASGKEVYIGGIAAPKKYKIGTKIKIGNTIYTVEDRGQAIVEKGSRGYNCDRIDLYMGKGEEAMDKAIKFGKQEVDGILL